MSADRKLICPLRNAECLEDGKIVNGEIHACRFWVSVQGTNPQTGAAINQGDCAIAWMPLLMIESSRASRETSAAVVDLRNSVDSGNQNVGKLMLSVMTAASQDGGGLLLPGG